MVFAGHGKEGGGGERKGRREASKRNWEEEQKTKCVEVNKARRVRVRLKISRHNMFRMPLKHFRLCRFKFQPIIHHFALDIYMVMLFIFHLNSFFDACDVQMYTGKLYSICTYFRCVYLFVAYKCKYPIHHSSVIRCLVCVVYAMVTLWSNKRLVSYHFSPLVHAIDKGTVRLTGHSSWFIISWSTASGKTSASHTQWN